MNIDKRIKSVIASQLNVPIDSVTNEAFLTRDLGADSLDTVEIIMAMEDEFNIVFSDDSIRITTVQEVINYITPLIKHREIA
jgi:acyl carrier protein